MMESRVGNFSSRMKDTKSKVQKSSGSIMSRASKTQDMLDELDQPVNYFTDTISEYDFGDIPLRKILKEGESLKPKTRAEGVGASEISKSST